MTKRKTPRTMSEISRWVKGLSAAQIQKLYRGLPPPARCPECLHSEKKIATLTQQLEAARDCGAGEPPHKSRPCGTCQTCLHRALAKYAADYIRATGANELQAAALTAAEKRAARLKAALEDLIYKPPERSKDEGGLADRIRDALKDDDAAP